MKGGDQKQLTLLVREREGAVVASRYLSNVVARRRPKKKIHGAPLSMRLEANFKLLSKFVDIRPS